MMHIFSICGTRRSFHFTALFYFLYEKQGLSHGKKEGKGKASSKEANG